MTSACPPVPNVCHQRGEVMSATGGMLPAATIRTRRLALMRPQPVIWSQPAVVMKRWEAGRVVAKLFAGPGGLGVEKSMSSAARRNSCLTSSAESGWPDESGPSRPWAMAFRAAEYASAAMPDDSPVASDEQDA